MKRKISLLMSVVLMVCLFAAASGSALAAGKDISIPAGSQIAMAVNLDHTGEITGFDLVEGELPSGLELYTEEGRLFLAGAAAAAGDFRPVIRLQPGDSRTEYALRIRVRASDNQAPAASEEPAETAAPAVQAAPGPSITKHPGGETVSELGSAIFVARADGATSIEW